MQTTAPAPRGLHDLQRLLPDDTFQRLVSTALMVFNDAILRIAIEFGLAVIDLRFVCS